MEKIKIETDKLTLEWNCLAPLLEKIASNGYSVRVSILNGGADYYGNPTNNAYDCQIYKCWWEKQGDYREELVCGRRYTTSLLETTLDAIIQFEKQRGEKI